MPNFHHHPDNVIFVRTINGVYYATLENFITDIGEDYESLPSGYIERYYEPNVRHDLKTSDTAFPQSLIWEKGDFYISKYNELINAKNLREGS